MTRWIVMLLAVAAVLGLVLLEKPMADRSPVVSSPLALNVAADAWAGLSLNDFLTEADRSLVLQSSQTITFYGIAEELGVRNNHLDPLTVEAEDAYYEQEKRILDRLKSYDLSAVSDADRVAARIYEESLRDSLASRPFANNGYLVSSYMDSYPTDLEWFMTSIHPLLTLADAEDYVSRLSEISVRFRELEDRLRLSLAIRAVPPKFILRKAVEQLRVVARTEPTETSYYVTLDEAFVSMAGVRKESQDELLAKAADILQTYVLPAYANLADFVDEMTTRASDDAGVWKQTNGGEYYAYLLRSYTTTDLTADEIYDLGLQEVARIQIEIQSASIALGFSPGLPIPELYDRLEERTGSSLGQETIDRSQALIDDIAARIVPAFARTPAGELIVVDGGSDTYFSPGTLDGSRPGMYFAPTATPQPIYELPTVTYHEAIPGHGFQSAYAYEADLPPYLLGLSFTAYSEGWALYAERLAWELGAYDENPYGNLGRLQDELFRAVRLVVDPGLHVKRWTYDEAVDYMIQNTGMNEDYIRSEVERYIVWPAQAVTYKIGMLEILDLRDRAKAALGNAFDLADFHDVVLGHGEVPLGILEELVDQYNASHGG